MGISIGQSFNFNNELLGDCKLDRETAYTFVMCMTFSNPHKELRII